mmetsp:Transcript_137812/g.326502  ORF Transcript_137812/g.326502 Transcript_137812/m.326502 type:complete len:232 (+) Transcript_137812:2569-3264(+)
MSACKFGSLLDIIFAHLFPASSSNVLQDGILKEDRLLLHQGNLSTEPVKIKAANVSAIQTQHARFRIVKAQDEADHCALARAAAAHKGRGGARRDVQGHTLQDQGVRALGVGEADILEGDLALQALQGLAAAGGMQRLVQDLVHAVDGGFRGGEGAEAHVQGAQAHGEAPNHGIHGGEDGSTRPAISKWRRGPPAIGLVILKHPEGAEVDAQGHASDQDCVDKSGGIACHH